MTKRQLATLLAEKTGYSAVLVSHVVQAAMDTLTDVLVQSGRLEWRDLGTFKVKTYPARAIHNPATGETITLAPRQWVGFRPAKKIRSRLTGPGKKKAAGKAAGKAAKPAKAAAKAAAKPAAKGAKRK